MLNRQPKIRISLKLRITLLVGVLFACMAVSLTAFGIANSSQQFTKVNFLDKAIVNEVFAINISAIGDPAAVSYVPSVSMLTIAAPIQAMEKIKISPVYTQASLAVSASVGEAQRGFSKSSIHIMLGIMALGLVGTYFIVGAALKPLTQLSETIANIDEYNLSEKIEENHTNDEILRLSRSFNHMLSRLETSFQNQQRFSANAAHELKTPLATIKTSLEVLGMEENPSSEEYRENAMVVENSVGRLIEIVNNLLLLSMSGAEQGEKVYVGSVVSKCIERHRVELEEKEITLNFDSDSCVIRGNSALLEAAIGNLIENAIKYNTVGGKIDVLLSSTDGLARLEVSDSGIGIDEDNLPHIFEPFYRADESRSKQIAGNGLGLSIVKSVIEKHGGEILVESSFGVGTYVNVTLPLCEMI